MTDSCRSSVYTEPRNLPAGRRQSERVSSDRLKKSSAVMGVAFCGLLRNDVKLLLRLNPVCQQLRSISNYRLAKFML
jgi:hypothetical protein